MSASGSRKIGPLYLALTLASTLLVVATARADLYSAKAAYQKHDYVKALELYRELAELGNAAAQATLSVMYVQGEGVKRDEQLGYAWARVAQSNGDHLVTGSIVAQLEPRVTEATRQRMRELMLKYGPEALQRTLLPDFDLPAPANASRGCAVKSAANPQDFYPPAAMRAAVSGSVLVESQVMPDGRTHDPQVWFALPDRSFDEAARASIRNATFSFDSQDRARTCGLLGTLKFQARPGNDANWQHELDGAREKARDGDPRSQLLYGYLLFARPEFNVAEERPEAWYVKAAQAGIPAAQFMTGLALSHSLVPTEKAKGMTWLDKAADHGSSDAQLALALQTLHGPADAPRIAAAQALLERALMSNDDVHSHGSDASFYLAALLAAGPEGATLDATRALDLIDKLQADMPGSPTVYEIRAAASAALGKFGDAQKAQRKALDLAKKLGWDTAAQELRLGSYSHKKAWRGNFFAP